jgi:hypothetical protein
MNNHAQPCRCADCIDAENRAVPARAMRPADHAETTQEAAQASALSAPHASSEGEAVPDGVWEALQRMIEDGLVKGPASQKDARTVMQYRDRVRFLAAKDGAAGQGRDGAVANTYASTQATNCAGCGEHKHTPLRIDAMGGYVCLTCIDQKLGALLGEFGYPDTTPSLLSDLKDWLEGLVEANFNGHVPQGVFSEANEYIERIEALAAPGAAIAAREQEDKP